MDATSSVSFAQALRYWFRLGFCGGFAGSKECVLEEDAAHMRLCDHYRLPFSGACFKWWAAVIPSRRPLKSMSSDRFEYLDLLRTLAIVGVTVMHSAAPLLHSPETSAVWSGLVYSSLCLFCVPILLMISGALMLGSTRPMVLSEFYGKRLVKILLPLLAWSVIYYAILCLQTESAPNVISFLKRFLTGLWSGPLWFLYMIVGVYLMSPISAARLCRPVHELRPYLRVHHLRPDHA